MRHLIRTYFSLLLVSALCIAPVGAGETSSRTELEARFAKLDREDAGNAYKLALELEAAGASDLASKAHEIVIGIDPNHRAARRALGYELVRKTWLRGDDLLRAKGFVHYESRWMTGEQFADATRPLRAASAQRAGESRILGLLARIGADDADTVRKAKRRFALADDKFKLAPLANALRCEPPSLRIFAAQELARLKNPLAIPALIKRAVHDPDDAVRVAVGRALRKIDSPDTVHPLGRALNSRDAEVRVRAAEAIAELGDQAGLGYVIYKWVGRAGDFPRVYFAQINQLAYIQDFDVEVAQTSFIADPIVGVLQEGVSHAVKIHATEYTFSTIERPAYAKALKHLSGVDHGTDMNKWRRFWHEHKERLMDERADHYRKGTKRVERPAPDESEEASKDK